MQRAFTVLLFFLISFPGFSQVFTGYGGIINDNASKNFYTQTISGLSNTIDTKFGVFGVTVNLTHSYVGDLNIFLISPDNIVVELSSGNGGNGRAYDNCLFTNNSTVKISSGKAPFKGSFKPEGSIGVVNNGQNPNGNWRLMIQDAKPNRDSGKLVSWNIMFSSTPSKLEPFINSTLPLILINTHGKGIPDDPRVNAEMRIIHNTSSLNSLADSSKNFNYRITIETRGSSSQSFPKKPYGFTTVNPSLADTNVSLIGLPSEHDWVLNATYNDKSLMRDVLAYELTRRTGRYATRYRYCELFINGNYQGIYVLMEKVKRDKNRVDISKLELKDTVGTALTGGYIVKIDKTTGNNNGGWTDSFPISPGSAGRVYFQFDYPNWDDMMKKQRDYIIDYIYKFEIALAGNQFMSPTNGYRKYADESTFIDLSIINEISKNVDGYRLSTYLYKDRDNKGGKLKMGPVWDFNLAFNNADYNNSSDPKGWEIDLSGGCPFWWKRFRDDSLYMNAYYCRWNQLRKSTFSFYNVFKFIDSTYKVLEEASYRNFQRWPVMGIYVWPNPSPLSYSMKEEVDSLKSWIQKRFVWMDEQLAVNCMKVSTCKPLVGLVAPVSTICKNQQVTLYADGVGNSFTWSPSKGLNTTAGRKVNAMPDVSTTYKVVMKNKTGCKDSATIAVKVLPLPGKTVSGNTAFCQGGFASLSVPDGAKTYSWSPTTGLDNPTSRAVKASPAFTTTYKVVVTDSMGCYDSAFVSVAVNQKPDVTIKASKDSVCLLDSVALTASGAYTYRWKKSPDIKDTTVSSLWVYPNNSQYTVVGKSDKGCLDTAVKFIGRNPDAKIQIDASANTVCPGAVVILTAKGGETYTWKKTADFGGSSSSGIQLFPRRDGQYEVFGVNKWGCSNSASTTIKVHPEVTVSLSGNYEICRGSQTLLKASGAASYLWMLSGGLSDNSGDQVFAFPGQSTQYQLIGYSQELCSDTVDFEIIVKALPALTLFAAPGTITEGDTTTLTVNGADRYLWYPSGSTMDNDTGAIVRATPLVTTLFKVRGTGTNQCVSFDSVWVTVNKKILGISQPDMGGFSVYPNPVKKLLNIESSGSGKIILRDLTGKAIAEADIQKGISQLDVSSLSSGMYILDLRTKAGAWNYRIVKE